ncbi:S8/S53 family peptidase [Actinomycetes bacterium KLBMP 9797]
MFELSRRRLLRQSMWTALAVPLGGLAPRAAAGSTQVGSKESDAYQAAFKAMVAEDPNVRGFFEKGREFLYRPRQLLVADQDLQQVLKRLQELHLGGDPAARFAGVTQVHLADVDIPKLVANLRDPKSWPRQKPPAVQPHHVTVGHDNIMGNPEGPPLAALPLAPPPLTNPPEGEGVLVGVCDTGIWDGAGAFHLDWLGGSYLPEADDVDPLYRAGQLLALQGGHGTFVAGVLRQAAPGVEFDPEVALSPSGLGDEQRLVAALDRLDSQVSIINLSLGYFTQDDMAPLPLVNKMAELEQRRTVVVASAGNSATDRPCYPAAMPTVVAVAAVAPGALAPAPYSNFGGWVDACADGLRTSTYVLGSLELLGLLSIKFGGYASWAGTSFAAPHVAGRLAAMMTANRYSAVDARQDLLSQPTWRNGYGVLVG